jgi:beta-glucosidase
MPLNYYDPHVTIDARNPASKPVLINGAKEGHVLVKNINNALPLNKPKLISVFGYDAVSPPANDVPTAAQYFGAWTLGAESLYDFAPFFSTGPAPQIALNGTIISGGELPIS